MGVLRTLGFYINFHQSAINDHQCCVLAHASPLSVLKHALGRKCSLMATPSKRDSVNAQSSSKFRSVDSQILLSGKILRTGFPVQQFHICASRGFFTLMAAKAINGHSILLLSGKILRTGFPVQQFHICASRGFLTLMSAKAINGH